MGSCALQVLQNRKYLAVADEEGYVSVLDTAAPLPRGLHDEGSTPAQWLAHHNAIFDVAWCKVRLCSHVRRKPSFFPPLLPLADLCSDPAIACSGSMSPCLDDCKHRQIDA